MHLLGQTLQGVGVTPLVGLEVLHAGLGLFGDDGRWRLVGPAGVGRTAVVVEIEAVRGAALGRLLLLLQLAAAVAGVEGRQAQAETGTRLGHLAAVARVSLSHRFTSN